MPKNSMSISDKMAVNVSQASMKTEGSLCLSVHFPESISVTCSQMYVHSWFDIKMQPREDQRDNLGVYSGI